MKVGDLVTLSYYGKRIKHMSMCLALRKARGGLQAPPIGLVVSEHGPQYSWETEMKYSISWVDNSKYNPCGRDNYVKYFFRKDLKMVKKAK